MPRVLVVVACLFAAGPTCDGQLMAGYVRDATTLQPIAGAQVRLQGVTAEQYTWNSYAYTSGSGYYAFDANIPGGLGGIRGVTVRALNHQPQDPLFSLPSSWPGPYPWDFVLKPVDGTPIVDAGPDVVAVTHSLPCSVKLAGSARDPDSWPQESKPRWRDLGDPLVLPPIIGPDVILQPLGTFDNPEDPGTTVNFNALGTHVLRLEYDDGTGPVYDTLTVEISGVQPKFQDWPQADAGPEIGIVALCPFWFVQLMGWAGDPGKLQMPPQMMWSMVSGPGTVEFSDPTDPRALVTFTASGSYVLQLTCDYGQYMSIDTLTVEVGSVDQVTWGALAHWDFEEGSGTITHDQSGHGYNGTLMGNPVWLPTGGMFGGALSFDGIDDRVNCGSFDPSAETGKLSICLWAKWNGRPVSAQGLIARRDNGGENKTMWSLEADKDTGKLGFFHDTSVRFGGDPVLPIGEWAHVAVSVDGTRGVLYINGEPTGAGPFALPSSTQGIVLLGASLPDGGHCFNGALDDIQLYDHPLNKTQIKTVMTGAEVQVGPNEVDLLAHWAFDEMTGHVAYDPVSACNGALMGGPLWQSAGEKTARGKTAGALRFDGIDDCVVTSVVLDPADGPFSVFAWVRGGGAGQVILSQDDSAGGVNWLAANEIGRLTTQLGGNRILAAREAITDGQWHEVGLVWDGTSRTLHVDGAAVAADNPAAPTSSAGGLNIGAGKNLAPGTFWSGLIDEVWVYKGVVRSQRSTR